MHADIVLVLALSALAAQPTAAQAPSPGPSPRAASPRAEADILPDVSPGDRASYVAPNPTPASREVEAAFVVGRNVRELAAPTPLELLAADLEVRERPGCGDGAQIERTGIVRALGAAAPAFSDDETVGSVLADGRQLWTFAVRSPGALALRVRVSSSGADVASDARVLVYGLRPETAGGPVAREVVLASGAAVDVWTGTIPGDTAFVEALGQVRPELSVVELAHFDRSPFGESAGESAGESPGESPGTWPLGGFGMPNGTPSACNLDPNCVSQANLAIGQAATGQMNFLSGGGVFICTGTLLNDFDSATFVPYFLSAFHCLNTQSEVASLEVVWDWRTSSCNGPPPDWFTLPRSFGQHLLATSDTDSGTDMAFMRLESVPPGQSFAGTSTSDFPNTAWGVSHPQGSWQRYVKMEDGFTAGCIAFDADDYHFGDILDGMTDKGSSGSAVFNQSGQVLGQLYGVCGSDSPSCETKDDWSLVYGEMQESYSLISYWLTLGGTIHVSANTSLPVSFQNGTPGAPFATVGQAYALAWDGARILMQAGAYDEGLLMTKELLLLSSNGSALIGL